MRAKIIAATGLLACLGLYGCDDAGTVPANTAQARPCNCQPPVQQAATPATHRRHRHWASYAHRQYSHSEMDASESYSYHSSSRVYDSAESGEQASGTASASVWVDFYGRSHDVTTASAAQPPDDRARRAPWHGYDEDCDDKK